MFLAPFLLSPIPPNFKCFQCAESALQSVIGDLSHTYFVGNAPMAHMVIQPTEDVQYLSPFKVCLYSYTCHGLPKYNLLFDHKQRDYAPSLALHFTYASLLFCGLIIVLVLSEILFQVSGDCNQQI